MNRRRFLATGPFTALVSQTVAASPAALDPIDYGRSFLQGKWAENRVRFWIESRTRILDPNAAAPIDYYQCASCKSENTFALKDLFHTDNYDFLPIFGPEDGVIFRRKAYLNAEYRQVRKSADMWEGQTYKVVKPKTVRLLHNNREIREATHAGIPLVAQTEISDPGTRLRAIIEFPVKTMNIHDRRDLYQVDSGPVAFPDLSKRFPRQAEALSLAFVAFNAPGTADFVIEAPTPISDAGREITRVHHYSKLQNLTAANRLYACD